MIGKMLNTLEVAEFCGWIDVCDSVKSNVAYGACLLQYCFDYASARHGFSGRGGV